MGCGCYQDEVASVILGQGLDQLVALLLGATLLLAEGAGMRLVDNDQLGAVAHEVVAVALRLDEVDGDDEVREAPEYRFAEALAFQLAHRAGKQELGVDVELLAQLLLPLLGEMGRTEDGEPARLAAVEQLAGDEAGLDRLADADVVRDEDAHRVLLEGDQQRDELVMARLDGDAAEGAEGAGAAPEAQARRLAQEARAAEISGLGGVGQVERGGSDAFQGREDSRDFFVPTSQRFEHEQVGEESGSTTHSRPRVWTREPTVKLIWLLRKHGDASR